VCGDKSGGMLLRSRTACTLASCGYYLKNEDRHNEDCVAFILLTVVRKMGAVLRSDNFVEGAKIVLRATRSFRFVVSS
jgi:hypothetical protein